MSKISDIVVSVSLILESLALILVGDHRRHDRSWRSWPNSFSRPASFGRPAAFWGSVPGNFDWFHHHHLPGRPFHHQHRRAANNIALALRPLEYNRRASHDVLALESAGYTGYLRRQRASHRRGQRDCYQQSNGAVEIWGSNHKCLVVRSAQRGFDVAIITRVVNTSALTI